MSVRLPALIDAKTGSALQCGAGATAESSCIRLDRLGTRDRRAPQPRDLLRPHKHICGDGEIVHHRSPMNLTWRSGA